jgi:hypothetical protein
VTDELFLLDKILFFLLMKSRTFNHSRVYPVIFVLKLSLYMFLVLLVFKFKCSRFLEMGIKYQRFHVRNRIKN